MKPGALKIAVALLASTLLTACAATSFAEPVGTTAVVPPPSASVAETPLVTPAIPPSPVVSSMPTFGYISEPSEELMAFTDTLKPHTIIAPENALGPEWRFPLAGIDYDAGIDLTYDEFMALLVNTKLFSVANEDMEFVDLTREQYDARPSNWINDAVLNLAQKPEWADINGDGVSEIVLVTRTGGGSEGGSVIEYAAENGAYRELLNFYIGMQNAFALAQHDGHFFLVVAFSNRILYDTTATPDKNGVYPETAYNHVAGYAIRHFSEDWVPECVLVENGETSIPEFDWFWGVMMTGK